MNDKVVECIYAAVDEANLDREGEPPIEKALDTPIQGSESGLDSLGLINFIVTVEENVEREFGVALVLGDDRALEQDPSPFESIAALAEYTETLISEQR
jgi:acyl carrier protein